MDSLHVKGGYIKQLNHDVYYEHTHHYLREVTTDPPDEVTEFLNELETTDESTTGGPSIEETRTTMSTMSTLTTEAASDQTEYFHDTIASTIETTISPYASESTSESSQTILIVLGLLLAILVIVCCVLACIFAKMRRKGFCTVEGTNQATCDDNCPEDGITLQQSPKESLASGKSETSRSSDKLLTK